MLVGFSRCIPLWGALPGRPPIGKAWLATAILIAASLWFIIIPARAQTVIPVTDGPSLAAAIAEVDTNASASYIINFENAITLTSSADDILPALNTTSGVTINGNNFTLDGSDVQRGFFVNSGTVAISNLTIQNAFAQGGAGGLGFSGGGGGGAGAGGALFVASGGICDVS